MSLDVRNTLPESHILSIAAPHGHQTTLLSLGSLWIKKKKKSAWYTLIKVQCTYDLRMETAFPPNVKGQMLPSFYFAGNTVICFLQTYKTILFPPFSVKKKKRKKKSWSIALQRIVTAHHLLHQCLYRLSSRQLHQPPAR